MEPVHPKVDGYDVVRYLCKGGEGQIYVVTKSQDSDKKEFVLKTRTCVGISDANDAIQEVLAMGRVAGRYNVSIHDAFLSQKENSPEEFNIHLVMEFCKGGDLHSFLHGSGKSRKLEADQVLNLTFEILMGLHAIHKVRLVHRDLKPENIFLTENHSVKIGDFGLATSLLLDQSGKVGGVEGTTNFMAPEIFSNSGATEKSDIFSVGCIMYEMLEGESLALSRRSFGLEAHKNPNWRAEGQFSHENRTVNAQLVELACNMLVVDPVKRPSLSHLLAAFAALRMCGDSEMDESSQASSSVSAALTSSRPSLSLPVNMENVSYRPLRKGEEREAYLVLAHAYEFDPRFYFWTYKVDAETRFKITSKLMEAVVNGAVSQKAVWVATVNDRIVACMIIMSPDDKKRPPVGVLLQSGWKLLKHTKLLLPGMKMYGTAMKEVDRVFPNQNSEWFLVNLGVLPEYQSHGIGDGMVKMVMKWADQQNTTVNSLVFHHRQVSFLERYGFSVVSQQDAEKQPSFFTLVRDPKEKGKVQISARTSMTFDSTPNVSASRTSMSRDSVAEEDSGVDLSEANSSFVDL